MTARLKKILCVLVLAVFGCAAAGCDAALDLYLTSTDDAYVQTLEVRTSDAMRKTIEASATSADGFVQGGGNWTLAVWLRAFSDQLTFADGTKFEYVGIYETDGEFTVRLERRIPFDVLEDDTDETEENGAETVVKNYFYVYSVEVTEPNPYNGLRGQYDEGTEGTLAGIVKNGLELADGRHFPSLEEAFPATAGYDPGKLALNYYVRFADNVKATGTWTVVDGVRYCLYERAFDDKTHTITYKYYAVNSLGWNVTALAVAAGVVVAVLLATRKSGKNEKKEIRFNY